MNEYGASRIKRAYNAMQQGIRHYQAQVGVEIYWYAYNPDDNIATHDVYDEGGRSWKPGVRLPAMLPNVDYATEVDREAGLQQVREIQLLIQPEMWQRRGLPDPKSRDRVLDRLRFDGLLYEVSRFQLEGRIGRFYAIYVVNATELLGEESDWDPAMTERT